MWSRAPNWRVAPPPSTCATTFWPSPGAFLLSSSATGSCRRYADMVLCKTALCSRGGPAADTVSKRWTQRFSCCVNKGAVACSHSGGIESLSTAVALLMEGFLADVLSACETLTPTQACLNNCQGSHKDAPASKSICDLSGVFIE